MVDSDIKRMIMKEFLRNSGSDDQGDTNSDDDIRITENQVTENRKATNELAEEQEEKSNAIGNQDAIDTQNLMERLKNELTSPEIESITNVEQAEQFVKSVDQQEESAEDIGDQITSSEIEQINELSPILERSQGIVSSPPHEMTDKEIAGWVEMVDWGVMEKEILEEISREKGKELGGTGERKAIGEAMGIEGFLDSMKTVNVEEARKGHGFMGSDLFGSNVFSLDPLWNLSPDFLRDYDHKKKGTTNRSIDKKLKGISMIHTFVGVNIFLFTISNQEFAVTDVLWSMRDDPLAWMMYVTLFSSKWFIGIVLLYYSLVSAQKIKSLISFDLCRDTGIISSAWIGMYMASAIMMIINGSRIGMLHYLSIITFIFSIIGVVLLLDVQQYYLSFVRKMNVAAP